MSPEALQRRAASKRPGPRRGTSRGGFTLVELLVVMLIILMVSAVALPVILPALNHRQVSESARILQGALVGARDAAVHANAPRGIRLLPDPTLIHYVTLDDIAQDSSLTGKLGQVHPRSILAANRIVALEPAPDYKEGRVNVVSTLPFTTTPYPPFYLPYPGEGGGTWPYLSDGSTPTAPVLMVAEALSSNDDFVNFPSGPRTRNNPTSWYWNIRVGDKIQIGDGGENYTVVGPMSMGPDDGNVELFVNVGPPGQDSPLSYPSQPNSLPPFEFLFLVNGYDDDRDGLVDEGWDGIDNDLDGFVDDVAGVNAPRGEWEVERWLGTLSGANVGAGTHNNLPYTIHRRPTPSANAREVALPSNVVVDLTTWGNSSPERSRLPVNRYTGAIDIMLSPQGEVLPNTIFSAPSSFRLADAFFHFWLAERGDLYAPSDFKVTGGVPANGDGTPQAPPFLPVPTGLNQNTTTSLQGENRLVTLYTRNGEIVVNELADFDADPGDYNTAVGVVPNYNPSLPFLRAQQGVRGVE